MGLFLLIIIRATGHYREVIWRRHWRIILLLSLSGAIGFQSLLYYGLRWTTPINVGLITGLSPIAMAVMSAIVLRESPARKLWIAAAISILGVGWILTNGQLSVFLEMDFNLGDILILAAIFSWAIYGVVAKKAMQEMSVLTITAYGLIVSSIVVLPIGIWEINSQIQPQINLFVIIAVLFISIGPTILSFLCWNQGVKLIGPLHASIYLNTIPIYTIILSVFYLDQTMSQAQMIGAVMVLGGSFYASKAA